MLKALADRPDVRLHIARGWILVGALGVIFIGAIAVAHYAFGIPVHDRDTGGLSTAGETMTNLIIVGGGMALFLLMGILLRLWKPDVPSNRED